MGITVHSVFVAGLCCLLHHMVSAEGFTCSFDTDACGWTQDRSDDFDWTRNVGDTASRGTGPSYDHTSGHGYYMYIETLFPSANTPDQKARLISPAINGTYQMCLVFYYHMYGFHIGTLNVYVSRSGSLGSPVWTKHKSQGDVWYRATVQIIGGSATNAGTNIVFEAAQGDSILADIAIDDVSLQGGPCPQDPFRTIRLISPLNNGVGRIEVYYNGSWGTVCDYGFTEQAAEVACRQLGMMKSWSKPTSVSVDKGSDRIWLDYIRCNGSEASLAKCGHSPWGSHSCSHSQDVGVNCDSEGINCTFDTNTCGWTTSLLSDFNWIRSSGKVTGNGNGPSSDHTSGCGSYMYIEASDSDTKHQIARLQSPRINSTTIGCLVFYYHMLGRNISVLSVYLKPIISYGRLVWTTKQSQGREWKKAMVQIAEEYATIRIMFEGVRGAGYQGSIAIDDVILTPGTCRQAASPLDRHEYGEASSWNNTAAIVGGVVAVVVITVVVAVIVYLFRRRRDAKMDEVKEDITLKNLIY